MNKVIDLSKEDRDWAGDVSDKIKNKMSAVVKRNADKIPYTAVNGVFDDRSGPDAIGWWTNGFWGGILWQLFYATKEECYREAAITCEEKLDPVFMSYQIMDHDSGFRWLPTSVARYRLEGNAASKNRGMLAAANFAGRFNLAGNFLRAWNQDGSRDRRGFAIIDCMMNLPLLYWASDVSEDPRFKMMAMAHADTVMKTFVRKNGSVIHIADFDPETGAFKGAVDGQGKSPDSSWTRGQGWGLYGFTLSYRHTGKREYLDTASKIADYVLSVIPEDFIIPVDYDQDKTLDWQDSSAAAVTACGLIELSKYCDDESVSARYLRAAVKLLRVLDEKSCCWDEGRDELLENCSAMYHEEHHNYPIIYADYYFMEAIFKLTGEELFIW